MRTYIWTIPTRLFHWLLAVSFAAGYLLGGKEEYLSLHAAFGSLIGGLIIFRIIQGFTGPKYARFGDFPISLKSLISFVGDMKQSKATHPGHNPLAAIIMLGIMITALLTALSGMLTFASGETGFLGFRFNQGADPEIFEELHEVLANIFLVLVGVHLTGILADTMFHPANGTIFSIFTGYKKLVAPEAKLNTFNKIFSVFWFVLPLMLFIYVLGFQPIPAPEKEGLNTEQADDTDKDED
jgi:cytochrome b